MNKFYSIAVVLAGLLLIAHPAAAQGNAENGKRLFVKNGCYQCHGYAGQGGSAGARLAPRPIPVVALIAFVRHPPDGDMPIYTAKVMSDAELTDVWAYLKSIPASPAAKDIPLLNRK